MSFSLSLSLSLKTNVDVDVLVNVIVGGCFARAKRAMPMIVDPGLYQSTKSDVFWVTPKRTLPTAFRLFTGQCFYLLMTLHNIFSFVRK